MPDKPVARMGSGQKYSCSNAASRGWGWKPCAGGLNNPYKGKQKAAVSQKGIRALCTWLLVNTPVDWTSLPHGDVSPWWEPTTCPGWLRKRQRLGKPLTCSEPRDLGPQAALCSPGLATYPQQAPARSLTRRNASAGLICWRAGRNHAGNPRCHCISQSAALAIGKARKHLLHTQL